MEPRKLGSTDLEVTRLSFGGLFVSTVGGEYEKSRAALRFLLSNSDIDTVLMGARSVREAELNVAVTERGPLPRLRGALLLRAGQPHLPGNGSAAMNVWTHVSPAN